MKPGSLFRLTLFLAAGISFHACKNDSIPPTQTSDELLFEEISSSGYLYYQNGNVITGAGPHGDFKLRFNATAATALDGDGELPPGESFPNGSILVKEVHTGAGLILYAVMKKSPSDANAGNGWIWAELFPSGEAFAPVSAKGAGCTPCHSTSPHRDFTRTFDLH